MDSALIHRARLLTRERGERDAEGEYVQGEPVAGAWFAARLMERGGQADRRRRQDGTTATVARGYELLAAPRDVEGEAVALEAGVIVETDCDVLGSPTLELAGDPERLNDGAVFIGWSATATQAGDRP